MAISLNCLICSRSVISEQDDDYTSRKNLQFREGLQLFCKLLQISENYVDKVFSGGGSKGHGANSAIGPPCCKECCLAFEQMLRLHQAIELMQANLVEQLDKVKVVLKTSVPSDYEEDPLKIPPDDILGKLRDQLLSCVRNSSTPSGHPPRKIRKLGTKYPKQPSSVFPRTGKECQPCSVTLERLPVNLLNNIIAPENDPSTDITIKQEISTSFSEPHCDEGRSIRKSKLKAFEFIHKNSNPRKPMTSGAVVKEDCWDPNDEEYVPSPEVPSPILSNNEDDNEEDYPWESEAEPLLEQISFSCETGRMTRFSLISPDTLLYQYTLIKVSQGYTHFTCQEPECSSPHFSDLSLNWCSLFSQIADHIKQVHSTISSKNDVGRKCPLCPEILPAGSRFRAHLVGIGKKREDHRHRIETVVCEICWRPIRNLSDFYRCHRWDHKNSQEKEATPEGPPPTLVSRANKSIKKLKKFKSDNPEEKPKLTLKMKRLLLNSKRKFPKKELHCTEQPDKTIKKQRKPKAIQKIKSRKISKANCTDQRGSQLKKQSSTKKSKGRAPQIGDHFCQILEKNSRESLLLYKSTLLKALYGVSLTCLESNCDHIINGTDFTAFEEFKNHVKSGHATEKPDAIWKCPLCHEELQTGEGFRCHLLYKCYTVSKVARNGFSYICTSCWRAVLSVSSLECHQWLHKSEIEKESALKNEEQPPVAKVQVRENERKLILNCRHCRKEFNAVANLKAHEATHLPKEQRKRYMCHQCPKLFLSPAAVRGHVERKHQRELMRTRTCPFCNKQFNWRNGNAYRRHVASHRNERPFVCEICGKAFFDVFQLRRHSKIVHDTNGERRWQCEFCEMSYKVCAHLKRHKRNVHPDKIGKEEMMMEDEQQRLKFTLPEYRPGFIGPKIAFPCPVCEKVFQLKSRMKKHWEKSCKNLNIIRT